MTSIRRIIVPTDFSPPAEVALQRAVELAKLDMAEIHLVHAIKFPIVGAPYEGSLPLTVTDGIRDAARDQMAELRSQLEAKGVARVTTEIAEINDPSLAIDRAVSREGADLVVMGTHGYSGVRHAVLGSVAERTIRKVTCPVLAVKQLDTTGSEIRRILLPVDFSAHSVAAVDYVAGLAGRLGASVELLHVVDLASAYAAYLPPTVVGAAEGLESQMKAGARDALERFAQELGRRGVEVTQRLEFGKAEAKIIEQAGSLGVDLIVMGTHGHTGLAHLFLGSVAEKTLRGAPCSVLVLKADR